jgi:Flp pilus assembly protein TadD
LLAQGRAREAVAPLEQAARERTNNARIETHLGKAFLDCGRTTEALARLQRAVEC